MVARLEPAPARVKPGGAVWPQAGSAGMWGAMSDAVFFTVVGLLVAATIALALVWPQGLGQRSPGPFGHAVVSERLEGPAPVPAAPPPSRVAP